jgi:hypothetical protein
MVHSLALQDIAAGHANESSKDLDEIEEWNEYGELKQQIGSTPVAAPTPTASAATTPSKPPAPSISAPGTDSPAPSPLSKQVPDEVNPSSISAARKDDTPLTLAMRQAGAEAAKKAIEKKASKSTALPPAKGLGPTEVPARAMESGIARSVEEPGVSATTTAAKIPKNLAAEGAKRTSIDKIAEEGARRSDMDRATESDRTNEQEHAGLSKEATMLGAMSASSTTKMKSPLSEDNPPRPSMEFRAANFEPRPRTHRGSSVSMASREEIEAIEKRDAIAEESEDTDESSTPKTDNEGHLDDSANVMLKDLTTTDEGEVTATKDGKTQEQHAKDPEAAGASVGD